MGFLEVCGLTADGSLFCLSDDQFRLAHGEKLSSISVGKDHTCGVSVEGRVSCWGENDYSQATPSSGKFTSVSVGDEHTCGLTEEGGIICWGRDDDGQTKPPNGQYSVVSSGDDDTCAISVDGSIECWGRRFNRDAYTPPGGQYVAVDISSRHGCAITVDGRMVCWGRNDDGKGTPPHSRFVSVSVGYGHSCGVTDDGAALCWGDNSWGQAAPETICSAITTGDVNAVRQQLSGTTTDCGGDSFLYTAIINRQAEVVRILLEAGVDPNAKDDNGNPVLRKAVSWGLVEIVRLLVNAGADVNIVDTWGAPLLHTAVDEGETDLVRTLLEAGADANARDKGGTSPTKLAFEAEEFEILSILIAAGAAVDFPPPAPRIRVIDRSESSLTVSVAGSHGLETYYALRRRESTASGVWVDLEVRDTDGRFEDQGLNADATYYYALRACNAAGCSELSSETGGVTESSAHVEAPAAPSLDGERVQDWTIASLSWNGIAGATYYKVYQDDEIDAKVSAPETTHVDISPNSSFNIFFLSWSFDKTVYRLKACNKAGCSPFSNSVTLP